MEENTLSFEENLKMVLKMESKTHNLWFMVWIRLYWTKMVMDDG
jgi:hypothetical protein